MPTEKEILSGDWYSEQYRKSFRSKTAIWGSKRLKRDLKQLHSDDGNSTLSTQPVSSEESGGSHDQVGFSLSDTQNSRTNINSGSMVTFHVGDLDVEVVEDFQNDDEVPIEFQFQGQYLGDLDDYFDSEDSMKGISSDDSQSTLCEAPDENPEATPSTAEARTGFGLSENDSNEIVPFIGPAAPPTLSPFAWMEKIYAPVLDNTFVNMKSMSSSLMEFQIGMGELLAETYRGPVLPAFTNVFHIPISVIFGSKNNTGFVVISSCETVSMKNMKRLLIANNLCEKQKTSASSLNKNTQVTTNSGIDFLDDAELKHILETTDHGDDTSRIFPSWSFDSAASEDSDDGLAEEVRTLHQLENQIRQELTVSEDSFLVTISSAQFDEGRKPGDRRVRFSDQNEEFIFISEAYSTESIYWDTAFCGTVDGAVDSIASALYKLRKAFHGMSRIRPQASSRRVKRSMYN